MYVQDYSSSKGWELAHYCSLLLCSSIDVLETDIHEIDLFTYHSCHGMMKELGVTIASTFRSL